MKKKKIFSILIAVIACVLIIGLIVGIVAKLKNDDSSESGVFLTWSSGNISTTTGKYVEDEISIYSSEFDCYGLSVALDYDEFKSEIPYTYAIYYYDYDGAYLSYVSGLSEAYSEDVPLQAESCRIVITDAEGEKISTLTKYNYSSKMTVTVASTQFETLYAKLASLDDVCEIEGQGTISASFEYEENTSSSYYVTKEIDVTDYDTVILRVATSSVGTTMTHNSQEFYRIILSYSGAPEGTVDQGFTVLYSDSSISYIAHDISDIDTIRILCDSDTLNVLTIAVI